MKDERDAGGGGDGGSHRVVTHAPIAGSEVRPRRRGSWLGRLVWLGLLAAIVGGIGVTFMPGIVGDGTTTTAGRGRFQPQEIMPVGAATVTAADMPLYLDALGSVTPVATATIKTRVAGQITRIAFTEGQEVKAGDPIAEIDDRTYRYALEQVKGQLMRDQAQLKNAEIDLARYQKLVSQDSLARQQLDTQSALVQQYQGVVKTDAANVDAAELNLAYTKITAPIAGKLGLKVADVGAYVQPGDSDGIVVVTQFSPISVVFSIPEDELGRVRAALGRGEAPEVIAFDRGRRKELARGKLATTDNQIDATTGTVKLRALFENADRVLFPNQFVNIRLTVETVKDALQLPAVAIQRGQPGTFVYRIDAEDTVSVQPVKLGPASLDKVVIAEGLAAGDRVVVDGTDKMRIGAKVSTGGVRQVVLPPEGQRGRQGGGQGAAAPGGGQNAGQNAGQRRGQQQGGQRAPGGAPGAAPGGAPGGPPP